VQLQGENIMSNNMLGGELATMQTMKSKFDEQAVAVQNLTSVLDQQVSSVVWRGPAADRFKQMWDAQFKTTLNELRQALNDASKEVANRAEAIRVATA
jgi:uncharacterized protein YukE